MRIAVTAITQNIDLRSGKQQSFLALELPSGRTLQVPVDEQTVVEVIKESKGAGAPEAKAETSFRMDATPSVARLDDATSYEEPMRETSQAPRNEDRGRSSAILWMQLPEEVLSTKYKAALVSINAPETMSGEDLRNILAEIERQFSEEDWQRALLNVDFDLAPDLGPGPDATSVQQLDAEPLMKVQAASPAPVVPVAPPINQISWSDGSPMIRASAPSIRTVPKDDMGNPIVDGPDVQSYLGPPGENSDEDGISSI